MLAGRDARPTEIIKLVPTLQHGNELRLIRFKAVVLYLMHIVVRNLEYQRQDDLRMHENHLTRRKFLQHTAKFGLCAGGAIAALSSPWWARKAIDLASPPAYASSRLREIIKNAPEARYWISTASDASCSACHPDMGDGPFEEQDHGEVIIRCQLCAQQCFIREGKRGKCNTRINLDGRLKTLVYGRPISIHVDPIEKKPFYHFLPGSPAFSLATSGCSLHCKFCQNWQISQARPEDYNVPFTPPETIVDAVIDNKAPIIAYTYNEPTVFTEYLTDIAREGKREGLRSVIISCGFMQEAPLAEMCEVLDGVKIDLKGFSADFYANVCDAELQPALRSIKQASRSGVHLELVNLVVPTLNDSEKMLRELAKWVAGELGPDVPIHYTRFHPDYQLLNLPPTPVSSLEKAREIALEAGIHYPFVGNVPGHPGNHTYCPSCGEIVIERSGFFIRKMRIENGKCTKCGAVIAGVWS